jgi:hypothetical protein
VDSVEPLHMRATSTSLHLTEPKMVSTCMAYSPTSSNDA